MNRDRYATAPSRQRGAALFVAVVLLLLASVMTLLALKVGVFEQRSTGNDMRAKLVNEAAEAGLAQGFEYLLRQNGDMLTTDALWDPCGDSETTFPCGAVSEFEVDKLGAPTTVRRRGTMYRLDRTGHTIAGLDDALSNYMLPIPAASKVASVGNGEVVAYGVAPLLCRVERPVAVAGVAPPVDAPIRCGTGGGTNATELRVVTFVSVARIPGESARATLVQAGGRYPLLPDILGKPPIVASGSADVTGGLQIVVNANAGGPGVPISVWTRRDIIKTGTTNTCYADEFFRYTANNVTPAMFPAGACPSSNPTCQTIRCDQCKCDADNTAPASLSYDSSGNLQLEGIDILDVEGDSSTNGTGTNFNVRSDALSYPLCEFPPDMFKFVFGIDAWVDNSTPKDCFNETKLMTQYQNPNSGALVSMGKDEAYLYANATKIIPTAATTAALLLKPGQSMLRSALDASSSGIIWCQTGCDIGAGDVIGSPAAPVILVLDGPVSIQGTVFGFVFIRDTGNSLNAASGSSSAAACQPNCMLQMTSGAAVYGALVVQGQMKANAGGAVIFDATVLGNISKTLTPKFATLPGAWNDQASY